MRNVKEFIRLIWPPQNSKIIKKQRRNLYLDFVVTWVSELLSLMNWSAPSFSKQPATECESSHLRRLYKPFFQCFGNASSCFSSCLRMSATNLWRKAKSLQIYRHTQSLYSPDSEFHSATNLPLTSWSFRLPLLILIPHPTKTANLKIASCLCF